MSVFSSLAGGRRSRKRTRGAAAVEFALVLPLFCALIFGLIDYGWYFYQRFSLVGAVRDGLRVGVTINQTLAAPNDCATVAINRATADLTAININVPNNAFTVTTSSFSPTKTMTLSGTLPFTPLVNFVPLPKNGMTYSMTMMFELQ